ncbi:MAG: DMT family transporter [Desulfovibrio sp.]|uniref:DMT family transporter n=1 Tax=Desulfovibrio sp. 7SRBS1 TaxID=3378064 RepID=UPI003B3EF995
MPNQKKAYAYGLVSVLLWSTVATAFKLALGHLAPVQLLLYASITSTLVLSLVLAVQGRLRLIFSFTPRQYLLSAGFGFLNPFLYYLILFKAYDLLPAQEAQPLNYTWAVALALLSIPLLGQKMRFADLAATFICYSGVVVISTRGDLTGLHFANPFGVTLALVSTIIWALYWIFNTKDTRDPVAGLLLNFLFGLPWIIVWIFCFSSFSLPSMAGLAGAVYVGVFEMGITFVAWLTALKNSDNASKVGNLIFISPFLSLVFISLFVGETILPSTFAGLGLIMLGLVVQKIRR